MEDAPTKEVGRLVHYTGQVQGVGFRATALAQRYPITGWVRNLPDGRVQLLVEGPEAEVSRFLEAVRAHWGKHIERVAAQGRQPTGEYRDFAVAR